MTDGIISIDEAARLLGTSRSAVGRWAGDGSLSTVTTRTRLKRLYLSEVLELKNLRDKGQKPRRVVDDVLMLKYKQLKLERIMDNITSFLRIPDKLVVFTDEELMIHYDRAKAFNVRDKFDARKFSFNSWLGILKNLHEEELKRLTILKNDTRPFVPFLKLCERIIGLGKLRKHKRISKALTYTDVIYLFIQARNVLRDRALALLAAEQPDSDPFRMLEEALSPPHRPVLEMLEKMQGGKV